MEREWQAYRARLISLLTDNGCRLAEKLRPVLATEAFARVFVSPMRRARETSELAGLGNAAVIDPDLAEWNYGEYEGLTPEQIQPEGAQLADFPRRLPRRRNARASGCESGSSCRPGPRCWRQCRCVCARTRTPRPRGTVDRSSRRAPDSISCSRRALCAYLPTTTNFPQSGSGTGPCHHRMSHNE